MSFPPHPREGSRAITPEHAGNLPDPENLLLASVICSGESVMSVGQVQFGAIFQSTVRRTPGPFHTVFVNCETESNRRIVSGLLASLDHQTRSQSQSTRSRTLNLRRAITESEPTLRTVHPLLTRTSGANEVTMVLRSPRIFTLVNKTTDLTAVEELHPDNVPAVGKMPAAGMGTWELTDPKQCPKAVRTALEMGYRHIDTAQVYDNEALVGDGLATADVDRDDIYLATKIWIDKLGYEDTIESAYASLDRLGVEHVDLLYVHWPAGAYDPVETLEAFDRLHEEGLTDQIGVSNFGTEELAAAEEHGTVPISANQIECHPMLPQSTLRDACDQRDIDIVAYSPLARGEIFDVAEVESVAEKHNVSPAQVSLAWLRQKGIVTIPKASTTDHLRDNWQSLGLQLDEADMQTIDSIEHRARQVDPRFAPWA